MKKIVVSGGFDPVHIGHLEMLKQAREIGSHLTVILNSDKFLLDKKGFIFMNFTERKKILLGFECVDKVIKCIDKDNTVCKTISKLREKNEIDIFANGGDRKNEKDIPEYEICKKLGVEMIFDVGGNKIQSSSKLLNPFINYIEKRPWGEFENLLETKKFLVKKLVINPGQKISVQLHKHRKENWTIVEGKGKVQIGKKSFFGTVGSSFSIPKNEIHTIENNQKTALIIIEVQLGNKLSEEDIIRLEDIYERV